MRKPFLISLLFAGLSLSVSAQQSDSAVFRSIYSEVLVNGECYDKLDYLCNEIGGRLAGSPGAAAAVEYTRQVMEQYDFDTVWLQPVMVPHWVRGEKEAVRLLSQKKGSFDVPATALGNSVGTGPGGVTAQVLEVKSFEELEKLGKKAVEGKIVFFNRPMDPTKILTFQAYGGAVDQRVFGASKAAALGAKAVLVRSMTTALDDVPHTGTLRYDEAQPKIPALAISTNGSEQLSQLLKAEPTLQVYVESHCEMLPDVLSYNVIGEITGQDFPDEYIVVGGHLDAWDNGDGAHDDGSGCVQSIEVLRTFKALGIRPRHSLRAVMYMNEENGLRGGLAYAAEARAKGEKHIAAIESDAGGFSPLGFSHQGSPAVTQKLQSWQPLFAPYNVFLFYAGGGGADIGPLAEQGVELFGFRPDPQRYFDYHHTSIDTFDKISKRELELGAATMAALVYLIDTRGL